MRVITVLAGGLGLAMSVAGCSTVLVQSAPHPGRPELASVHLESDQVRSGCPIRLQIVFHDADANIARALASWTYEGSGGVGGQPMRVVQDGFAAVPLDPALLAGKRQGEAVIVLTPLQPGAYQYSVQLEDEAGRRSNVLEQSFTILPQPAGQPIPCGEPARRDGSPVAGPQSAEYLGNRRHRHESMEVPAQGARSFSPMFAHPGSDIMAVVKGAYPSGRAEHETSLTRRGDFDE